MTSSNISSLTHFLTQHHVLTLATVGQEGPHATPLFYAFDEKKLRLILTSDPASRHIQEISAQPQVALGIYLETEEVEKIQGCQIWGTVIENLSQQVREIYVQRFPFSAPFLNETSSHRLYEVKIQKARLIDNRLGFGAKLEWSF